MHNIVDYESSSTRDRERIDLLGTTNSTGRPGCCIPTDMCCEHKVRQVKDLLKSFHNKLETTLIAKSVLAQNSMSAIKDHLYESLGKAELKSGGHHRHDYIKTEEKEQIREELRQMRIFQGDTEKEQVVYNQTVRRVWENLSDEGVDIFLSRNQHNYKVKKTYRFN